MRHKEFVETELNKVGNKVWVCDYRYVNGFDKKPARHVKPTYVEIRPSSEGRRSVYYSETVYIPFKKNGELNFNKQINPFDNTGYRMHSGVDIQVFLTKQECTTFYKELCKYYIPLVEETIEEKTKGLKDLVEYLSNI